MAEDVIFPACGSKLPALSFAATYPHVFRFVCCLLVVHQSSYCICVSFY